MYKTLVDYVEIRTMLAESAMEALMNGNKLTDEQIAVLDDAVTRAVPQWEAERLARMYDAAEHAGRMSRKAAGL